MKMINKRFIIEVPERYVKEHVFEEMGFELLPAPSKEWRPVCFDEYPFYENDVLCQACPFLEECSKTQNIEKVDR